MELQISGLHIVELKSAITLKGRREIAGPQVASRKP